MYGTSYDTPAFLLASLSDPEITLVGSILQKSGLHAIPRLWSVIKGDIYLIGVSPLERQDVLSSFTKELLEREYGAVREAYSFSEGREFRATVERCLPIGLVSYAELHAYHIKPWQRTVVKDLDKRVRLLEEAHYFLGTRWASLRLFVRLILKGAFRILNAAYMTKLVEAPADPPIDSGFFGKGR
jgi:hypothetical protein